MSIALVEEEISRFLASKDPEVLCLQGKWGVGKSYAWNKFVKNAVSANKIALASYSYVSLFGISTTDSLKYAIFENKLPLEKISERPDVDSVRSSSDALAKQFGIKSLGIMQLLPWARGYTEFVQSIAYLSIKETIICIDDLERKSSNLQMRDILGIVANLRDQKRCKVVLILNDDAFQGDDDEKEFKLYNEKIIDISIDFIPDARDCARIAIEGDDDIDDEIRDAVIKLDIPNIRIIKLIQRHVSRVATILEKFEPDVIHLAVKSIVLFTWCVYMGKVRRPWIILRRLGVRIFLEYPMITSLRTKNGDGTSF